MLGKNYILVRKKLGKNELFFKMKKKMAEKKSLPKKKFSLSFLFVKFFIQMSRLKKKKSKKKQSSLKKI